MDEYFGKFKELIFSGTAKDTYVVFVGNIISFAFGIVFAVLGARAVEPSGWGIFSAAGGFVIILFAFSELGLSSGLFKFVSGLWHEGKRKEASEVESVIFSMRAATSLIFSFLMILFAKQISSLILKYESPGLIYLTAFGLIGSLLMDFQISLLQAKGRWISSSFLIATTNFFRLAGLIAVKLWGTLGIFSLFAVFFLSPVATFIVSLIFERPKLRIIPDFLDVFKKVSKFSLWMGVNRSVGSVSSRVDSILLLQLTSPFEAGIVGAARQLSGVVLVLVGSFATVIAPRFASYKEGHLKKYYKKVVLLSLLLGLGVLIGILFVNPVISLFGSKYALSRGVLKWLFVGLIPFALATPSVNALIYSFHKPQFIAILSTVQLPLIILGNILLIPRLGIYGPVLVIALWNFSTLVITYFKAKWELSHTA